MEAAEEGLKTRDFHSSSILAATNKELPFLLQKGRPFDEQPMQISYYYPPLSALPGESDIGITCPG